MPIYMKFDGIDGEATDGTMEVMSFSWGATQTGGAGGGGGGGGKVNMQDLHFVKISDKSSPVLLRSCATGKHIPWAEVRVRESPTRQSAGRFHFYKIRLEDVVVSSYEIGGNEHGAPAPVDQVALKYAKFRFDVGEQTPDGQ